MKKRFLIVIIGLLFIATIGEEKLLAQEESAVDVDQNIFLVRRNLFQRNEKFTITDASFYQYGTLEVDGSWGGAVYRFKTTPDAIDWLITNFSLKEYELTSVDELFRLLSFSRAKKPLWWKPEEVKAEKYYKLEQELPNSGHKLTLLLYDKKSGVVYFVEDYSRMGSI